jgi:thioredoxin-related protein
MTSQSETEQTAAAAEAAGDRQRLSPRLVGGLFIVLLMGFFVLAQVMSRTGEEIRWVHQFDTALATAKDQNKRVFLLLYEPESSVAARYDNNLFTQRVVRANVAATVPCRVAVDAGHELLRRYRVTELPAMLMLNANGTLLGEPLTGAVIDEKVLNTYITSNLGETAP